MRRKKSTVFCFCFLCVFHGMIPLNSFSTVMTLSLCLMMFLWCDDDFRRTPGTTTVMMMMMVNSRKEWKKQHHFPGGKHSRWSWFSKREGFLHDSEEERDKRRTKESSSWVGFQRRDHDQNCHHHHQFRFKKERILFVPDFMREREVSFISDINNNTGKVFFHRFLFYSSVASMLLLLFSRLLLKTRNIPVKKRMS